jgi:RNA recognition motif-containing protein
LRAYFGRYGRVSDCVIMRDRHSGHPRGFGFVSYDEEAVADRVAAERHELDGRQVEAKRAVPRSECIPPARATTTTTTSTTANNNNSSTTAHLRATKKIFVGGLPATCSDRDFYDYFARFGEIAESQVMYDHQTSNSRGFGFVTFSSEATVERVVSMDHDIMGKFVEVKRAEPKQVLEARRNGGGNGSPHVGNGQTTMTTTTAGAAVAGTAVSSSAAVAQSLASGFQVLSPLPSSFAAAAAAAVAGTAGAAPLPLGLHPLLYPGFVRGGSPVTPSAAGPWLTAHTATSSSSAGSASPPQPHHHHHHHFVSEHHQLLLNQQLHKCYPYQPGNAHQAGLNALPTDEGEGEGDTLLANGAVVSGAGSPDSAGPTLATTGMGYYAPATNFVPGLAQFVHNAFYGASFPQDAATFGGIHAVASACADRRMHPYSLSRQRVERSYR